MIMKYNTATLPNGLRVIHLPSTSPVVYCGYQIGAGSRHELPGDEGLAHFCEHVTFKGTARRSAWNILNCLESVGGDLNAFTNKEDTVFYAAVPQEHTARAIDLLTDIVFRSVYPQREIDKEVEVICDEIESYNDSPADLIYDDFENVLFRGGALGHSILGTAERVRAFTTADALRFTRQYYRPENAVFFIYGNPRGRSARRSSAASLESSAESAAQSAKKGAAVTKLLQKAFSKYPAGAVKADAGSGGEPHRGGVVTEAGGAVGESAAGKVITRSLATHQAHVMLGSRAYAIGDGRRMSLCLLSNILGGPGMNSRLNVVLREHSGLVYTVDSSVVSYGDTGTWCVYLGCDGHDVERCLRLVRRELDKFRSADISAQCLAAAKRQLKGQLGIACDNRENFALDFGRSFLHTGQERDLGALCDSIDAVSAASLRQVAEELFDPAVMTTLIYR